MYLNRKGLQFSNRDVWDCAPMEKIIASWVKKFYEYSKDHPWAGVPSGFYPDGPELDDEALEVRRKEWLDTVKFIYESLEAEEPLYLGGFREGSDHGKEVDGGYLYDMEPNDEAAWEKSREEMKVWNENKVKAMELFGKHLFDMWV